MTTFLMTKKIIVGHLNQRMPIGRLGQQRRPNRPTAASAGPKQGTSNRGPGNRNLWPYSGPFRAPLCPCPFSGCSRRGPCVSCRSRTIASWVSRLFVARSVRTEVASISTSVTCPRRLLLASRPHTQATSHIPRKATRPQPKACCTRLHFCSPARAPTRSCLAHAFASGRPPCPRHELDRSTNVCV